MNTPRSEHSSEGQSVESSNADQQSPEGSARGGRVPPRMSINSPPVVFIVGLLTVPVAFMLCVHYVPAPITWPAAIAGVIILGFTTRWLTARQVRKEDARYRAQQEEPIPSE